MSKHTLASCDVLGVCGGAVKRLVLDASVLLPISMAWWLVDALLFFVLASLEPLRLPTGWMQGLQLLKGLIYWVYFHALLLHAWRANVATNQRWDYRGSADVLWRRLLPLAIAWCLALLVGALGMACLVIPGIYCSVAFLLTGVMVVCDQRGPTEALGRCLDMVRGSWWAAFVISLFPIVVLLSLVGVAYRHVPVGWFEHATYAWVGGVRVLIAHILVSVALVATEELLWIHGMLPLGQRPGRSVMPSAVDHATA